MYSPNSNLLKTHRSSVSLPAMAASVDQVVDVPLDTVEVEVQTETTLCCGNPLLWHHHHYYDGGVYSNPYYPDHH